jgi:hypothetical protein
LSQTGQTNKAFNSSAASRNVETEDSTDFISDGLLIEIAADDSD